MVATHTAKRNFADSFLTVRFLIPLFIFIRINKAEISVKKYFPSYKSFISVLEISSIKCLQKHTCTLNVTYATL